MTKFGKLAPGAKVSALGRNVLRQLMGPVSEANLAHNRPKFDLALRFNGVDEYVEGDVAPLSTTDINAFTVVIWYRVPNGQAWVDGTTCNQWAGVVGNDSWMHTIASSSGGFPQTTASPTSRWYLSDSIVGYWIVEVPNADAVGQWIQEIAVYSSPAADDDNRFRLFRAVGHSTALAIPTFTGAGFFGATGVPPTLGTSDRPVTIGARGDATLALKPPDDYFNGEVAEFAIFDCALTDDEVRLTRTNGFPADLRHHPRRTSLRQWLRMGNGLGDTAAQLFDQTPGFSNDGFGFNIDQSNFRSTETVPVANFFTVGGSVSYPDGFSWPGDLVLQNNGADNLTVTTSGSYVFPTSIVDGGAFSVTVLTQPLFGSASILNHAGNIAGANITNANVTGSNQTVDLRSAFITTETGSGGAYVTSSMRWTDIIEAEYGVSGTTIPFSAMTLSWWMMGSGSSALERNWGPVGASANNWLGVGNRAAGVADRKTSWGFTCRSGVPATIVPSFVEHQASATLKNSVTTATSPQVPLTNTWQHFMLVLSGGGATFHEREKIFINGLNVANSAGGTELNTPTSFLTSSLKLAFGGNSPNQTGNALAKKSAAFYNFAAYSVALTGSDAQDHFSGALGGSGTLGQGANLRFRSGSAHLFLYLPGNGTINSPDIDQGAGFISASISRAGSTFNVQHGTGSTTFSHHLPFGSGTIW